MQSVSKTNSGPDHGNGGESKNGGEIPEVSFKGKSSVVVSASSKTSGGSTGLPSEEETAKSEEIPNNVGEKTNEPVDIEARVKIIAGLPSVNLFDTIEEFEYASMLDYHLQQNHVIATLRSLRSYFIGAKVLDASRIGAVVQKYAVDGFPYDSYPHLFGKDLISGWRDQLTDKKDHATWRHVAVAYWQNLEEANGKPVYESSDDQNRKKKSGAVIAPAVPKQGAAGGPKGIQNASSSTTATSVDNVLSGMPKRSKGQRCGVSLKNSSGSVNSKKSSLSPPSSSSSSSNLTSSFPSSNVTSSFLSGNRRSRVFESDSDVVDPDTLLFENRRRRYEEESLNMRRENLTSFRSCDGDSEGISSPGGLSRGAASLGGVSLGGASLGGASNCTARAPAGKNLPGTKSGLSPSVSTSNLPANVQTNVRNTLATAQGSTATLGKIKAKATTSKGNLLQGVRPSHTTNAKGANANEKPKRKKRTNTEINYHFESSLDDDAPKFVTSMKALRLDLFRTPTSPSNSKFPIGNSDSNSKFPVRTNGNNASENRLNGNQNAGMNGNQNGLTVSRNQNDLGMSENNSPNKRRKFRKKDEEKIVNFRDVRDFYMDESSNPKLPMKSEAIGRTESTTKTLSVNTLSKYQKKATPAVKSGKNTPALRRGAPKAAAPKAVRKKMKKIPEEA